MDHTREIWSTYPRNLCLPAAEVDAKSYDRRLARAEEQLFVKDKESEAGVLEIGPASPGDGSRQVEHATIQSTQQLEALCQKPRETWIFFLHQTYSWGQLQVSADFLRKLFTFLCVRPEFLETVFLFGEKAGPVEQAFSSFFSHCRPLSSIDCAVAEAFCSYDVGYNIKYVARHGRPFPRDPFSVRETGVYHSFDAETQQERWILVQASGGLRERLEEYYMRPAESQAGFQIRIHGMIFQCASYEWRDYLVYLEDALSKLFTRGFYTNVTGPQLEGDIEADFADIRQLQLITDKLEQLLQVLQRNIDIGQEVQGFLRRARKLSPSRLSSAFDDTESVVASATLQQRVHSSRIQSLISRAKGAGMLVQNILDIRATDSNAKMNIEIHELAKKNARETKAMSIVSLISAIFLPAMFLATLFGTNFFSYEDGNLHIASNFWIYVVIAAAMSGITVFLWVVYQRKRKSKLVALDHEKGIKTA